MMIFGSILHVHIIVIYNPNHLFQNFKLKIVI